MFILSDGVQRTGIVQLLGTKIASLTGDSETKQLGATVGLVGPISGFINNTAAVAILLPMVTDIAHEGRISPSKLLLPLSYASMFGGMLTLIGTSTNILASQLSAELLDHPFGMFEFTQLGIVVTIVGIVASVVGVAALTEIHIVVSALAGALAMVLTGCLRPQELYDAVQWDVIFLLAGVIPLGIALQATGGADLIAALFVLAAPGLPAILVLGLMYVVTAVLTNIISNNASVVLMVPVAVEAARQLGANAFAFVLAVTFAASTAFMTPVGYQTNLLVYGPGGYRFTDYLKVGAPLQSVFAVVTTLGIAFFWGLAPS